MIFEQLFYNSFFFLIVFIFSLYYFDFCTDTYISLYIFGCCRNCLKNGYLININKSVQLRVSVEISCFFGYYFPIDLS